MARSAKSSAKRAPKRPTRADKTLLQEGTDSLRVAQETLTKQIAYVSAELERKRRKGEVDTGLSSHLAFLGEKQSSLTREQRQLESHTAKAAEAMTAAEADELVVSHVLHLPIERRAAIAERLKDAGAVRSVL
jgi:hypothetical protein